MGVQLGDLIPRRKISLQDLSGKTIAIDAFNTLYQFSPSFVAKMVGLSWMEREE